MALRGILFYELVVKVVVYGHRLLLALLQMADEYISLPFLGFHDPVKLRLCILNFQVRVGSKRNPDI